MRLIIHIICFHKVISGYDPSQQFEPMLITFKLDKTSLFLHRHYNDQKDNPDVQWKVSFMFSSLVVLHPHTEFSKYPMKSRLLVVSQHQYHQYVIQLHHVDAHNSINSLGTVSSLAVNGYHKCRIIVIAMSCLVYKVIIVSWLQSNLQRHPVTLKIKHKVLHHHPEYCLHFE